MTAPIWKDYIVDFGSLAEDDFQIIETVTSQAIYSGHAYRRPGDSHLLVRINDICADWLQHVLPTLDQGYFTPSDMPVTFEVWSETAGMVIDTVQFYGDWSYDPDYDPTTDGMSFPVVGRIDGRQWIPFSVIDGNDITMVITFTDGTTQTVIVPLEIQADFNADYNEDFAISLRTAGSGTAFFDLSQWSDVQSIDLNGLIHYDVVTECGAYALYYLNAYGGWDTLLVEGNERTADALTRHTMAVEYDNNAVQARGIKDYAVELARTYTLHTGLLTDAQSERMHHLLNSPDVYLWEFATERMLPVVLKNTTTEYKTYKNGGRRMAEYTIDAQLAKQMVRR